MDGRWVKTICRMCTNGCGIIVKVEDGVATEVQGDPEDPRTEGELCPKGKVALSLVYSPDRLKDPLLRIGEKGEGKWKPITWQEALNILAERLKMIIDQYGAKAISVYRGQASDWGAPWHYALRFMNVLGSPNICTPVPLCFQPGAVTKRLMFGGVPDYYDWSNTKCMIIWGANPTNTNEYAVNGKKIEDAHKRGAKLIVIDPVATSLAEKADLWLQINPGTDCALALAFINVAIKENLIDTAFVQNWTVGFSKLKEHVKEYTPEIVAPEVGISPQVIREAARLFSQNKPGIIYDRNGLDQYLNTVGTVQAIDIFLSITGNVDTLGGNMLPTGVKTQFITMIEKLPKTVPLLGDYPLFAEFARQIPHQSVIDAILTEQPYPIKAMIMQGGNPVVTIANTSRTIQAMEKVDFLAVMDLFLTRTAQYADLVLPASTFLETTALTAYPGLRTNYFRLQQKVIEPVGNSWPDWKLWFELGRALGYNKEFSWDTVEEAIDEQLQPSGYTVDEVKNNPIFFPLQEKKYEREGFWTPSGKVELYSSILEKYGYKPLPDYKKSPVRIALENNDNKEYSLVGTNWPKPGSYVHSFLRNIPELRALDPKPLIMINPKDAQQRNIKEGELVTVTSPQGAITITACLTNKIKEGVVGIAWGWGEAVPQANINDLTDDSARDMICGTTSNREFLCEVEPLKSQI